MRVGARHCGAASADGGGDWNGGNGDGCAVSPGPPACDDPAGAVAELRRRVEERLEAAFAPGGGSSNPARLGFPGDEARHYAAAAALQAASRAQAGLAPAAAAQEAGGAAALAKAMAEAFLEVRLPNLLPIPQLIQSPN